MGLGFGLGQGYSDAQRIFNPAAIPGFVILPPLPAGSPSASTPVANTSPFAFLDTTIAAVKTEAAKIGKEVKVVEAKVAQEAIKVEDRIAESGKEERSSKRI